MIIYLLQVSFLNFQSLKVRDLVGILVAACPLVIVILVVFVFCALCVVGALNLKYLTFR